MKDDIWTYGSTKLLLLMACKEMTQRLEGTGVTCLTAWPGIAGTVSDTAQCLQWRQGIQTAAFHCGTQGLVLLACCFS